MAARPTNTDRTASITHNAARGRRFAGVESSDLIGIASFVLQSVSPAARVA
jgi:hypothetical protein